MRPKSFFEKADRIVMGTGISEKLYKKYLRMIDGYEYVLKPFEFKPSFYCTDGFCAWWDVYYFSHSIGNVEHMLGMVESGFILPALGKKLATSGRGKNSLINFVCKNIFISLTFELTNVFPVGKVVKKDVGSSKTSAEVKKPTGVKIKTEIEPSKPKVNRSRFLFNFSLLFRFQI
jgi:hypothetical protein